MSVSVIIAGGGRGLRMANAINKQFIKIHNRPIIAHTIEKFHQCSQVDCILIVVPEDWIDFVQKDIVNTYQFSKVKNIIAGGTTRQESVFNGLTSTDETTSIVLIHDAVRPLIEVNLIEKVIQKAEQFGAAILAVPAQDTIKFVQNGVVKSTPDREKMWQIQTPQGFKKEIILRAYQRAIKENIAATDDSALVENLGIAVHVVEGDYKNIKITRPMDLEVAKILLKNEHK